MPLFSGKSDNNSKSGKSLLSGLRFNTAVEAVEASRNSVRGIPVKEPVMEPVGYSPVVNEHYGNTNDRFAEPAVTRDLRSGISTIPSKALAVPGVDFKRDILGIADPSVEVNVIKLTNLTVEPIQIPEIVDKYGKLSDIIERYENGYSLSVVPLEMTTILPQVKKLQRHEILEYKGKRYASSTERVVSVQRFQEYKDKIYETLAEGQAFVDNLHLSTVIDGIKVETLKFNMHELQLLFGYYRLYDPKLITTSNGDQYIVVGDIGGTYRAG